MSNEKVTPIEQHRINPNSQGHKHQHSGAEGKYSQAQSMAEQGIFSNQANSFQKIIKFHTNNKSQISISHNMRQITLSISTVHFAETNGLVNVDDNSSQTTKIALHKQRLMNRCKNQLFTTP